MFEFDPSPDQRLTDEHVQDQDSAHMDQLRREARDSAGRRGLPQLSASEIFNVHVPVMFPTGDSDLAGTSSRAMFHSPQMQSEQKIRLGRRRRKCRLVNFPHSRRYQPPVAADLSYQTSAPCAHEVVRFLSS